MCLIIIQWFKIRRIGNDKMKTRTNSERKSNLKISVLLFLLITNSVFILAVSKTEKQKPNIIFIMSDDHASKAISAYYGSLIKTPHIDRIAQEGILFKRSYVTNSLCAPSRAAMLTGKYSCKNGLRDNRDRFDSSQQTFPKLLRKAGYQTFIVGKWHLKTTPTGFDDWKILYGQGTYYNPLFLENGDTVKHIGYTTDIITDFAIEELENRNKEKPFALLIHHKAPHRNWMPAIKYLGAFDTVDISLPETFYDNYNTRIPASEADMRIDDMYLSFDLKLLKNYYLKETGTGGEAKFAKHVEKTWEHVLARLTPQQYKTYIDYLSVISKKFKKMNLKGRKLTEWKYRRFMRDYLSSILSVDESVGKILKYLDDNNLTQNTIVVYTSDQGFYLGEHRWYDKRWMYEESFSTPLLIRYPKEIKPNTVSNDFVINIDYSPTFLDYAGVSIPKDIQGKSLRKILQGNTPENWRNSVYYHYYEYPHGWHKVRRHYGVRTERYKLIYFYGINIWELYDLKSDPHELNNIYESMKNTETVAKLKLELNRLKKEYNDFDK